MSQNTSATARTQLASPGVARLFIEIAIATDRRQPIPDGKKKKLAHVLHALAVVAAGTPVNDNYELDINYAGYVKKRHDACDIFIPFHLGAFFPDDHALDELIEAAHSMIINPLNPICISGSATFLGASKAISDLDYCEYFLNAPFDSVPDSICKKFEIGGTLNLAIAKIKCLRLLYTHPWPELGVLAKQFLTALPDEKLPSVKIDGVYTSSAFGLIPASNLTLLVVRSDVEGGSALKSFVFQEAVLVRGDGPPRVLVNPSSLGGYLNFLRAQARDYVATDPLKSLKRSLCFFLLTMQYEPAEAIINLLRSEEAEILAIAKRDLEVDALLEALPPRAAEATVSMRAHDRLPPDILAYTQALIHPRAEDLANKMSGLIDVLYTGLD